jgi:hypothetical protein
MMGRGDGTGERFAHPSCARLVKRIASWLRAPDGVRNSHVDYIEAGYVADAIDEGDFQKWSESR